MVQSRTAHLVALEVNEDKCFPDFLDRNGVPGEVSILHHFVELVRLNGKRPPNARTWREAVEVEGRQERLVRRSDCVFHLIGGEGKGVTGLGGGSGVGRGE